MASVPLPEKLSAFLSEHNVRLPVRLDAEHVGVVEDADGRDVVTVDVNGERPDGEAVAIATAVVLALNAFAQPRDLLEPLT